MFCPALLLVMALQAAPAGEGRWLAPLEIEGTVDGVAGKGKVLVYLPRAHDGAKRQRLVVALHGWSHRPEDFKERTRLAKLADDAGAVVVLPAMGKSVYESRFYPQTRGAWGPIPGARWVGEVVLPWARGRFPVSSEPRDTAIIGYSTGGRGALVVARRYPGNVGFVASLSGTYALQDLDPMSGEYRIHAAVFGERGAFPERWRDEDVFGRGAVETHAGIRVFLAHGAKDPVVPAGQLKAAQAVLGDRAQTELDPNGAHDWAYWSRALERAFKWYLSFFPVSKPP